MSWKESMLEEIELPTDQRNSFLKPICVVIVERVAGAM